MNSDLNMININLPIFSKLPKRNSNCSKACIPLESAFASANSRAANAENDAQT